MDNKTVTDQDALERAAQPELWCTGFGQIDYLASRELEARIEAARQRDEVPDVLMVLEHPPTYTVGRRSGPEELPFGRDWYRERGIEVLDTNRGGRVTYHAPGQLVGYAVMSLRPLGDDVHRFLRLMEEAIVRTLGDYDVRAEVVEGLTGVWTAGRKIASIGVHVSRGITTHGFAINADMDLEPWSWIVPCGLAQAEMTSIARETGAAVELRALRRDVVARFAQSYGRSLRRVKEAELRAAVGAPPREGPAVEAVAAG